MNHTLLPVQHHGSSILTLIPVIACLQVTLFPPQCHSLDTQCRLIPLAFSSLFPWITLCVRQCACRRLSSYNFFNSLGTRLMVWAGAPKILPEAPLSLYSHLLPPNKLKKQSLLGQPQLPHLLRSRMGNRNQSTEHPPNKD